MTGRRPDDAGASAHRLPVDEAHRPPGDEAQWRPVDEPHRGPVQPSPGPGTDPRRRRRDTRHGELRQALVERWDVLGVVAAGGALGSAGRWGLAQAMPHAPGSVPWATFWTNVSGAAALGILMVLVTEMWSPSRYVRPFLAVGVLGGLTTFSTYMVETRALLVAGQPLLAGGYLFGTLAAGLVVVWASIVLTRTLLSARRRRARRSGASRGRGGTEE